MKLYTFHVKYSSTGQPYEDEIITDSKESAVKHFLKRIPQPHDWDEVEVAKRVMEDEICTDCEGSGLVDDSIDIDGQVIDGEKICQACKGTGIMI